MLAFQSDSIGRETSCRFSTICFPDWTFGVGRTKDLDPTESLDPKRGLGLGLDRVVGVPRHEMTNNAVSVTILVRPSCLIQRVPS